MAAGAGVLLVLLYIGCYILLCIFLSIAMSLLKSEKAAAYFNKRSFVDPKPDFKGWDFRPWLVLCLFVFGASFDRIFEKQLVLMHTAKEKKYQDSTMKKHRGCQELAKSQGIKFITFTNDNAKVWMSASGGFLFLLDLKSKDIKKFPLNRWNFSEDFLSPEGDFFFNDAFVQTSDGSITKTDYKSFDVIGFASPSKRVVAYDHYQHEVFLYDFKTKEKLWNFSWEFQGATYRDTTIWSADRKVALVQCDYSQYFLLNVETGEYKKMEKDFTAPQYLTSDAGSHELTVLANRVIYRINTLTQEISAAKTHLYIKAVDPVQKIYFVTEDKKDGWDLAAYKMDAPHEPVEDLQFHYDRRAWLSSGCSYGSQIPLKAYGSPWALDLNIQGRQAEFVNLKNKNRKSLGRIFPQDQLPMPDITAKAALSPSGKKWVFANFNMVEIFSVNENGDIDLNTQTFNLVK